MNWTLVLWQNGKRFDEQKLGEGVPIPRVGEQIRVPENGDPLEAVFTHNHSKYVLAPVKSVQYDFTNKEVYVYLAD